ncbi:hypothetical protein MMC25_000036 [Agyrium rufum]|nr:hypothetical protein [Agyrium rufum]
MSFGPTSEQVEGTESTADSNSKLQAAAEKDTAWTDPPTASCETLPTYRSPSMTPMASESLPTTSQENQSQTAASPTIASAAQPSTSSSPAAGQTMASSIPSCIANPPQQEIPGNILTVEVDLVFANLRLAPSLNIADIRSIFRGYPHRRNHYERLCQRAVILALL